LADRGYVDLHYLRRVQDEGGFFLIRAKAGMNPQVLEAFREDGKRLRSLRHKSLQKNELGSVGDPGGSMIYCSVGVA